MAQEVERLGADGSVAILCRHNFEFRVRVDAMREVDELAVHLGAKRGFREACADCESDLASGWRGFKVLCRSVFECDAHHEGRKCIGVD